MSINSLINRINEDLKSLRKLMRESSSIDSLNNIYSFYHGEELIMIGTLKEISKYTMYPVNTLKNYSYPSHLKRTKNSKTALRVIKLSGDSE